MSAQTWESWDPPSPCPGLFTLSWPPPPPVRANTRLVLFETLQLVNNLHRRAKTTDHSVWKQRKKHSNQDNIRNDVITLRSIHSLLNISRMKILYTDILPNYLSKFHKYGSYNFFPSGRPHFANHPLPLSAFVHFCLTPSPP